ncbi:MAG: hypothetical protein QM662_04020, partial [Gordonia sp. (in: high G+C Gram-positive bacteria)]
MALGLLIVWLGSGTKVAFVAGIGVWGFAIGALPPIFQARVMRLSTPAFRPLAGSVVVTALNVGVAAGAGLGAITLHHGQTTLIVSALIAAVTGVVVLLAHTGACGDRAGVYVDTIRRTLGLRRRQDPRCAAHRPVQ